jgi:hypothetical protein
MPDPAFTRKLYGEDRMNALVIKLDDGSTIFRPMGLSDSPGGASAAGQEVSVIGVGIAIIERRLLLRVLGAISAALGVFCILITQVRSAFVLGILGVVVLIIVMAVRGRLARATGLAICGGVVVFGAFAWATSIGSGVVNKRFATLTEESPEKVYYSNRGLFLEYTMEEVVFQYPFGAGLGRWGMMNSYFGNPNNLEAPAIHAEIQPTAWVYDGGLVLLFVGYLAIGWAILVSGRIAIRHRHDQVADQATIVMAYSVATLAGTFGRIPFHSQTGIMFWVLNAAVFSAALGLRIADRERRKAAA